MGKERACDGNYYGCDLTCAVRLFTCDNEARRRTTAESIKDGSYFLNKVHLTEKTYDSFVHPSKSVITSGSKKKKSRKPDYHTKNKQVFNSNRRPFEPQPLPITIENYHISTTGTFEEINQIPPEFKLQFRSRGSSYYVNDSGDTLIRVSDHWGYNIRFCAWFLGGYERVTSFVWTKRFGKKPKVGMIKISQLVPNVIQEKNEINSRHPY